MKRYLQFLTVALSAAALFAACDRTESDVDVAGGKEIRFSAAIGQYQTKATDTAFEEGDVVGLFAAEPVSVANVPLTWTGNALEAEAPLRWGEYQPADQAVKFYAYYPYAEGQSDKFEFTVPVDQSLEEADFKAADLMIASTMASPKDESVLLHFAHRMSRAVFDITDRVDGDVAEVVVDGVAITATVDLKVPSIGLIGDGKLYSVKAAPVSDPNGNKAWAVILPPQNCQPVVSVKMTNGEVYTLEAEETVAMGEGRSYNVTIILDETMSALSFSADVTDWIDQWGYLGKDYDPGKLPVQWFISTPNRAIEMEQMEDGLWYALVPEFISGGYMYLTKRNNYYDGRIPYNQYFGWNLPYDAVLEVKEGEPLEIGLSPDNQICLVGDVDAIEVWLDAEGRKLTVTTVSHKWESLGKGKMLETSLAQTYGLQMQEFDVDIDVDANLPGVYRVRTPYANWTCPDGFYYRGGEDLIIYSRGSGVWGSYFNDTFTGVSCDDGQLYISSDDGYFDEEGQYFEFYGVNVYSQNKEAYVYGKDMYIVLPGGTRPEDLEVVIDYMGLQTATEAGTAGNTLVFDIYAGMDVQQMWYKIYEGKLSATEIRNYAAQDVRRNGSTFQFINQGWKTLNLPATASGTFTMVALVYGINNASYGSCYYSVLLPGDDAPEAQIGVSLSAGILPDSEVDVHITLSDPNAFWTLVLDDEDYAELPREDVYNYILANGQNRNVGLMGSDGADLTIDDLAAGKNYHVLVAGENVFESTAWAEAEITTAAEPRFQSFGTGRYTDNFMNAFGEDGYSSEVEILQAVDNPNRYRLMNPYKAYWENPNKGYDSYAGMQAAWIDFVIDGDYLYYAPYFTGYYEDGFGPVKYHCRTLGAGQHYPNNVKIQEGVYNIAPWAEIVGSRYGYGLYGYVGVIYIEMPGYTYTPVPDSAGAPAKRVLVR